MLYSRNILLLYLIGLFVCVIFPYSIIGYIFTVITFVVAFIYFKENIYFLFIYFPIRPIITDINNGLTFVGDVIIVISFCIVLWNMRNQLKVLLNSYSYFIYFVFFLIIGSLMAYINDVSPIAIIMENRALAMMALLAVVFFSNIWDRKDLKNILSISVITAFFISLHGIIEKISARTFLVPEAWTDWNLSMINASRVYGTLANPNVLAMYLLTVFFLSFLPIMLETKFKKVLPLFQIIIFGTALLTVSRGSFLAFSFGFLLFIVLNRPWKTLLRLSLTIVISVFFIYHPANLLADYVQIESNIGEENIEEGEKPATNIPKTSFLGRLKTMLSDETIQASTEWGRIYIVLKGLEIFREHPIVGTGFGTFGDAATLSFGSPIYDEYKISDGIYTDNQYIHILVSTGIIGTLLLLIFLIQMLRKLLPSISHRERSLFLSITIVLLFSCLYYNVIEDKSFMLFYFSLLGFFHQRSRGSINA